MIKAVINRLKADEEVINLLGVTEDDWRIYPLSSNNNGPCIVYNDTPISNDGRIKVNRLELRVIDHDTNEYFSYDHIDLIIKAVSRLLIIPEDEPGYIFENINIMSCFQNGGGSLEDPITKLTEKFLYLNITWRCL